MPKTSKKKTATEVMVHETAAVAEQSISETIHQGIPNVEAMLMAAIEKGAPVETIEKVMEMGEKIRARMAKESFNVAMAELQQEMPVISKDMEVREKMEKGGGVRYKFTPLASIVKQVGPIIAKHGFSYTIRIINDEKMLTAVCIVTHKDGHTEESSFSIPIGAEQYMSDVQKYGARSTFAKRYAFTNAFGIMTGDGDNDGQGASSTPPAAVNPEFLTKIREMINVSGIPEEKILKKFMADSLDQIDEKRLLILAKSLQEKISELNRNIKPEDIPTVEAEPVK